MTVQQYINELLGRQLTKEEENEVSNYARTYFQLQTNDSISDLGKIKANQLVQDFPYIKKEELYFQLL